jgi:hypothetical protein
MACSPPSPRPRWPWGGLGLGLGLRVLDYRGGESDRLLLLMIGLPAPGAIGCLAIALVWSRQSPRAPLPGSKSTGQGSSTL